MDNTICDKTCHSLALRWHCCGFIEEPSLGITHDKSKYTSTFYITKQGKNKINLGVSRSRYLTVKEDGTAAFTAKSAQDETLLFVEKISNDYKNRTTSQSLGANEITQ